MKALLTGVTITLFLVVASPVMTEPWSLSADVNLTLTQNAYSDNWVGGEAGAISWTFNSNSLAEKQLHEKVHSKNTLKLSFGQTHHQGDSCGPYYEKGDKDHNKSWQKKIYTTQFLSPPTTILLFSWLISKTDFLST